MRRFKSELTSMEESCAGVLSKYDYVQCARQDMTKKERKKNLEAPSKAE